MRYESQTSIKDKDEQYDFANLISRRQLQALQIDECEEEDRWRYNEVLDKNDYRLFFEWIHQIEEKNAVCNYLNSESLKKYLYKKLSNAIKRMKKPEVVKVYFCTNSVSRGIIRHMVFLSIKRRLCKSKDIYTEVFVNKP